MIFRESKLSKVLLFILVIVTLALLVSSCTATSEAIKAALIPKVEIRALSPRQAIAWGEANKKNDNALLFTIHSENMKGFVAFLVSLGVDVKWIKSGSEIDGQPQGQKGDNVSPPDKT